LKLLIIGVRTHSLLAAASKQCHIAYRQRVPADQAFWWTPSATLCRGRFCHLVSQDQHTLEEDRCTVIRQRSCVNIGQLPELT